MIQFTRGGSLSKALPTALEIGPILIPPKKIAYCNLYHIKCWYRVWYTLRVMEMVRKITVEIPGELLDKAQKASGQGITQTVRTGLQLVAASHAYARLRQLRGKVRFAHTATELKADR